MGRASTRIVRPGRDTDCSTATGSRSGRSSSRCGSVTRTPRASRSRIFCGTSALPRAARHSALRPAIRSSTKRQASAEGSIGTCSSTSPNSGWATSTDPSTLRRSAPWSVCVRSGTVAVISWVTSTSPHTAPAIPLPSHWNRSRARPAPSSTATGSVTPTRSFAKLRRGLPGRSTARTSWTWTLRTKRPTLRRPRRSRARTSSSFRKRRSRSSSRIPEASPATASPARRSATPAGTPMRTPSPALSRSRARSRSRRSSCSASRRTSWRRRSRASGPGPHQKRA